MVPTSATCTTAEAVAAPVPVRINSVVAVTPKAMPSVPSTNCAPKPISTKTMSFSMACPSLSHWLPTATARLPDMGPSDAAAQQRV